MALTKLDKFRLMGNLKGKINDYNDLYFETRSKYSVEDLLTAIIDLLFAALESKSTDNYLLNALKGVDFTVIHYTVGGVDLEVEIADRIAKIEEKYNQYLEINKEDEKINDNPDIRKIIKEIKEDVLNNSMLYDENRLESSAEQEESEEVIEEEEITKEKLTEKITAALMSLQEEVDEYKAKVKNLEKQISSDTRKIEKRESTIESQKIELKELRSQIAGYKKQEIKQGKNIEKLEQQTKEQETLIKELSSYQERSKEILLNHQNKITDLSAMLSVYHDEEKKENKKKLIEEAILKILTKRDVTIEELVYLLNQQDIQVSAQLVKECLMKLKQKVNIESNEMRNFSSVYKIMSKKVETDKSIVFTSSAKSMDILVVSDMHFGRIGNYDINVFDKMYEYCSQYGISLILNLGDLFSYDYQANSDTLQRMQYNNQILEDAIKKLPYDKKIHQAILGGNHDRHILEFGIDPLEVISSSRTDFIHLGYDHASILLGNDPIMLHHINRRFPEPLNGTSYNNQEFLDAIREYYENSPFNQEDTYVDLFGHFHKSVLNEKDGYALVPSMTVDRIQNGAWHLKVYFNELGSIENIIFIPLISERKLIPVNETVYKKIKTR